MDRIVFFADILGFGALCREPGASPAIDALTDVARILSVENTVSRFLNLYQWERRFALSDSLFLVGTDCAKVCEAASEFFFNLAFYNVGSECPVLIRGAIAEGNIQYAEPIFPETGHANLVGEAVVSAVSLEKYGPKGPRLFISRPLFDVINKEGNSSSIFNSLDEAAEGFYEILWLLPPELSSLTDEMSYMVAEVCNVAIALFERHGKNEQFGAHYAGYLDLTIRSLIRLRKLDEKKAAAIILRTDLRRVLQKERDFSEIPGMPSLFEGLGDLLT